MALDHDLECFCIRLGNLCHVMYLGVLEPIHEHDMKWVCVPESKHEVKEMTLHEMTLNYMNIFMYKERNKMKRKRNFKCNKHGTGHEIVHVIFFRS